MATKRITFDNFKKKYLGYSVQFVEPYFYIQNTSNRISFALTNSVGIIGKNDEIGLLTFFLTEDEAMEVINNGVENISKINLTTVDASIEIVFNKNTLSASVFIGGSLFYEFTYIYAINLLGVGENTTFYEYFTTLLTDLPIDDYFYGYIEYEDAPKKKKIHVKLKLPID